MFYKLSQKQKPSKLKQSATFGQTWIFIYKLSAKIFQVANDFSAICYNQMEMLQWMSCKPRALVWCVIMKGNIRSTFKYSAIGSYGGFGIL